MTSFFAHTNRLALISISAAVFTLGSFCVGVIPIPLTAWVCFPGAILSGCVALFTGIIALRQVRVSGARGRGLALIGIWTGLLSMLAVVCFTTFGLLALTYGAEIFQRLWPQTNP